MKEEIVKEIAKECSIEKENYIKLLVKICRENNVENIKETIKNYLSVSNSVSKSDKNEKNITYNA